MASTIAITSTSRRRTPSRRSADAHTSASAAAISAGELASTSRRETKKPAALADDVSSDEKAERTATRAPRSGSDSNAIRPGASSTRTRPSPPSATRAPARAALQASCGTTTASGTGRPNRLNNAALLPTPSAARRPSPARSRTHRSATPRLHLRATPNQTLRPEISAVPTATVWHDSGNDRRTANAHSGRRLVRRHAGRVVRRPDRQARSASGRRADARRYFAPVRRDGSSTWDAATDVSRPGFSTSDRRSKRSWPSTARHRCWSSPVSGSRPSPGSTCASGISETR